MKKVKKLDDLELEPLFNQLCQFAPIANPNHTKPVEKVYKEIFSEIKEHCLQKVKSSLQDFSNIYDPN